MTTPVNPRFVEISVDELSRLREIEQAYTAAQSQWGETVLAVGTFTARLVEPARPCTFATWQIDASGQGGWSGFATVYGKANADRIVRLLTEDEARQRPEARRDRE